MKSTLGIAAIAALGLISGTAMAQSLDATGTLGSGVAAATDRGAVAGGVTAGQHINKGGKKNRADRRATRDRRDRSGTAATSSTSTYGAGAVNTSRRHSSAAVTSGASANGPGSNSAGTTVDVYGETRRDGSSADVYGDSAATADEPRR